MVKIREIEHSGETVTCKLYVEGCETAINASYNGKTGAFFSGPLPPGYEYCHAHLAYAKRELEKMYKADCYKRETTIMWC